MVQIEFHMIIERPLEAVFDGERELYEAAQSERLRMEEAEYLRPVYFRDEMVSGTFKSFVHEHHFAAFDAGRTVKCEVLEFSAPYGVLGWIAERIFLRPRMKRLLAQRNEAFKTKVESEL